MTDLNKEVEVELHDADINEIVEEALEEAQEPKGSGNANVKAPSEEESIGTVAKASKSTSKTSLPKTKAGKVSAAVQKLNGMKKEDFNAAIESLLGEDFDAEEFVSEDVDTNAELAALCESEATLSEEFKEKTAVIFEAAVQSKLAEEIERLEENYREELSEEVATIKEDLVGKVDSYLNYVVESWMEENKVAIHNGLRTEIAEGFMNNLKDLFVESYVDVPESKVDLVDELASQVEELEESLNKTTGDAIALAEELEVYKRNTIIAEASRELADTQAEKLKELAEGIDFDGEENFAKKVATIKESYFSKEIPEAVEVISEDVEEEVEISSVMANYLAAIKKTSK